MSQRIPDRRDSAGVDKSADLGAQLAQQPFLAGQLLEVTLTGPGLVAPQHALGRAYQGAWLVGSDDVSAAVWAALGARVLSQKAARKAGVDVTRRLALRIDTLASPPLVLTFYVF